MSTLQRYLNANPSQTEFWRSEAEQQQPSDSEDWGLGRGAEPLVRRAQPDVRGAQPDVRGAKPEQCQAGRQQLSPWCQGGVHQLVMLAMLAQLALIA